MKKNIMMSALLLAIGTVLFSGCAKSVTCTAQDNSELRVSVLEDSIDPLIVTYRWNPFFGGWFMDDVVADKSTVTASMTQPAIFTIWGSKRIVMDGKKDTVYLGEDAYKCNNNLSVLTTLVEKINQEKINDRLRALGSSMDQGRF